jgi:hypothetical protein
VGLGDVLGGLGGFVGGIVGNAEAGPDQEKARQQYEAMLAAWQALNPEAGQSAAASLDPATRNAQMDALGHLQNVYQQGGMTLQDRVAQEQAMQASAMQERAQRGAIEQQMAARGQGGGGAELAAKLMGAQTGAVASHMAGASSAAAAQQRALQAMLASGEAAGGIRSGDLAASNARDAMARFNAGARIAKTQGLGGAYGQTGAYYAGDAQRIRNQDTGMGQGLGTALGSAGDAFATDGASLGFPQKKKNDSQNGYGA